MSKKKKKGKGRGTGMHFQIPVPKQHYYNEDMVDFFKEYWKPLCKMFHARTRCEPTSEDLAQIVMIKLWMYHSRVEWSSLGGVISRMAHNAFCDHLGQVKRHEDLVFVDDVLEFDCHDKGISDPYRKIVSERSMGAMEGFMNTLSGEKKEIFIDYYTHKMSREEISDKYGKTRGNIGVQLYRVRKDLLEYLLKDGLLPEEEWVYER